MELTGKIIDMSFDLQSKKAKLLLEINEKQSALKMYDNLHEIDMLDIKISKHREKRSTNANNYAWALMCKIADLTKASKDEIYLLMLKRYGRSEMISVLTHVPVLEYFKYGEKIGESKLNGKEFTHYRIYKGSSEFDTREMSVFIDGIVSEADELGIQTLTPNELLELKSMWKE